MSNNPPTPPAIVAAYHIDEGVIRYFMLDDEDWFDQPLITTLVANGYRRDSVHLIDIYDSPPASPMTVRQVIAALQKCDPDLPVLLDDGDGWFVHVSKIESPSEATGYVLPTLFVGNAYNCRAW